MIKVDHLTKKYGPILAVDDISFEIEPGRIYGFLGPNGAGKSTTMNMITGYIAATEGTITVGGHDIVEEPVEAKKCIGYLPELPPVYTDMTPREYLEFVYELKGLPKKDKAGHVDEIIVRTGLIEMQDRLIANLSKGYRQRVGLAMALIGYPQVIILDEPTVGLDPAQIIEIRELIKSLGKDHTVILSSHILSEVSAICDVVLIISHGKLIAIDTPENLGKKVRGGDVVTIKAKAGEDRVRAAISAIPQKISADISEETPGVTVIVAHCRSEQERDEISFALSNSRIPVISMTSASAGLEQVFLELTQQEMSEKNDDKEGKKA